MTGIQIRADLTDAGKVAAMTWMGKEASTVEDEEE